MTFAKRTFQIAAVYGFVVLVPMYFQKSAFLTHLVYYYGFIGCALAWQAAFLVIAANPVKFRAFMIPAIAEKVLFGLAVIYLKLDNGIKEDIFIAGVIDLIFAYAFWLSFQKTASNHE